LEEIAMTISWFAVTLLASGTILVVFMLALFANGKRYLRPPGPDRGVGFAQDKLAAEEKLSSLAPRVLEAADKEKAVSARLRSGAPLDQESHRGVSELLREADVSGLWRSFGTASALIEDDPEMARDNLETLSSRTQAALDRLAEAEEACEGAKPGPAGVDGFGRGKP
jgi:hypothetical protein